MKNVLKILFISMAFLISISANAFKKTIVFTSSEPDAKIYVDNQFLGTGNVSIVVLGNSCVNVKVEKAGFFTVNIPFCNKKGFASPPKTYYQLMTKDDAYDATTQYDQANTDIEIKTSKNENDAWKLLSLIVTSYFDILETTDQNTGYIRTSWVAKKFDQNTFRTMVIIKRGSIDPLTYKVKIISEQSEKPNTSIKNDEEFKPCDRILRKYENLIPELQNRLK